MDLDDWCFVNVDSFRRQMRWIAKSNANVLPLVEAVELLRAGQLPGPSVAITFDDGYRNNVEVALPILEDLRLPATIFLATGMVGKSQGLWPSRIIDAVAKSTKTTLNWEGRKFDLSNRRGRMKTSAALQSMVKELAGDDPEPAAASLEAALARPTNPSLDGNSAFAIIDQRQIQAALKTGLIEFGAHSVTHPLLSHLDDGRLAAEIDDSIAAVEQFTGRPCRTFAYPNGRTKDFDDRAVERLRSHGIVAAVSTETGANFRSADPLRLRRWGIGNDCGPLQFWAILRNLAPTS